MIPAYLLHLRGKSVPGFEILVRDTHDRPKSRVAAQVVPPLRPLRPSRLSAILTSALFSNILFQRDAGSLLNPIKRFGVMRLRHPQFF
jgi:hypothetical protein